MTLQDPPSDSPTPEPKPAKLLFGGEGSPSPFQKKMLWAAITAASFAVIAWVAGHTIKAFGAGLQLLQPVLVPLAAAGILAYLLEPLVRKLAAKSGSSRFRAMVLVFSLFHLLMLFILLSVAVPTIGQVSNLASAQARGDLVKTIENGLDQVLGPLEKYFAPEHSQPPAAPSSGNTGETSKAVESQPTPVEATKTLTEAAPPKKSWWKVWLEDDSHSAALWKKGKEWLGPIFSGFLGSFGYIVGFLMVPIYLYYFLKDADSISRNWSQMLPLRASDFKTEVVEVLTEINGYLIAFFRGAMLVSIVDGVLVGFFLLLIGMPYATLIGLCVALFGLMPYVGHLVCWVAAVGVSLVHFSQPEQRFAWLEPFWAYPLLVTAIFAIVMKVNALVTAPKIIGEAVGLHPMTVIFSVLFWSLLFGPLLGALLAVPLSAAVKVLFRRYIWQNWAKKKEAMDAATVVALPGGDL